MARNWQVSFKEDESPLFAFSFIFLLILSVASCYVIFEVYEYLLLPFGLALLLDLYVLWKVNKTNPGVIEREPLSVEKVFEDVKSNNILHIKENYGKIICTLRSHNGQSALHVSARQGLVEMSLYLISIGCDQDLEDDFGLKPIHHASLYWHSPLMRVLSPSRDDSHSVLDMVRRDVRTILKKRTRSNSRVITDQQIDSNGILDKCSDSSNDNDQIDDSVNVGRSELKQQHSSSSSSSSSGNLQHQSTTMSAFQRQLQLQKLSTEHSHHIIGTGDGNVNDMDCHLANENCDDGDETSEFHEHNNNYNNEENDDNNSVYSESSNITQSTTESFDSAASLIPLDKLSTIPPPKSIIVGDTTLQSNFCIPCGQYIPLRGKHCHNTDRCIEEFDHFCPWVSNTVGKGNYRYFLSFIWLTTILSLCMIVMSFYFAYVIPDQTEWIKLFGLSLGLMCILTGFGLLWLSIYHVKLVHIGSTTYEDIWGCWFTKKNPYRIGFWKNLRRIFSSGKDSDNINSNKKKNKTKGKNNNLGRENSLIDECARSPMDHSANSLKNHLSETATGTVMTATNNGNHRIDQGNKEKFENNSSIVYVRPSRDNTDDESAIMDSGISTRSGSAVNAILSPAVPLSVNIESKASELV